MFDLPFFERLRASKRVLVAGAGGGFDVFAGLPIFFALRKRGVDVALANLPFRDSTSWAARGSNRASSRSAPARV